MKRLLVIFFFLSACWSWAVPVRVWLTIDGLDSSSYYYVSWALWDTGIHENFYDGYFQSASDGRLKRVVGFDWDSSYNSAVWVSIVSDDFERGAEGTVSGLFLDSAISLPVSDYGITCTVIVEPIESSFVNPDFLSRFETLYEVGAVCTAGVFMLVGVSVFRFVSLRSAI